MTDACSNLFAGGKIIEENVIKSLKGLQIKGWIFSAALMKVSLISSLQIDSVCIVD